ncbi:hypothetical protein FOPG_08560 [Fusarium oxysporum f. sp. conglutinans race 2 54008]|uniref:SnoaL-like domain-containing protein n=8 Tax=Fusarium oxysporum species complex TaxID=171631 RepID=N1S5T9_FUSC4|nr:uncharacterized protein FOIG_14818 [Fusarium odoratissimum NRRL 54006]EGU77480.1 hypothetical protein FOXB_11992 [Fusarium oxysporum f. sp. conglutinans Fo5176]EMT74178.1 hypothetical protein FOC4_g10002658 [Fusarium odoratissimum]ENH73368.1 hypothetical protein FOC1_g10008853 [Fusarium oxysporum f. sp. cubense race 1]EXL76664.1 hypothetical protein FOPG_08560 [Fusarium oxysporum f. sp. conglutinans race 2 54008]KAF6514486.1 hypothetical protein HZS61_005620 [Fusarium oxysporum f. sp. congl
MASASCHVDWTSSLDKYEKGFESIFIGGPETTQADLEGLFTQDYTSIVDGKRIEFPEFVEHIQHLRQVTTAIKVQVTHFLREGNQLAERHFVTAEFSNKPPSKYEVFLFATVDESGRIERLVETLRQTDGLEEHRDLGSARS